MLTNHQDLPAFFDLKREFETRNFEARVEGALGDAQRVGRGLQHLLRQRRSARSQIGILDDAGGKAGPIRLRRIHRASCQQHPPRARQADRALQPPTDAELGSGESDPDEGGPERSCSGRAYGLSVLGWGVTTGELDGVEILHRMKFTEMAWHPIVPERRLNLIEQINQTWTILVSLRALPFLFSRHRDVGGFRLNLGTSAGTDIESL